MMNMAWLTYLMLVEFLSFANNDISVTRGTAFRERLGWDLVVVAVAAGHGGVFGFCSF